MSSDNKVTSVKDGKIINTELIITQLWSKSCFSTSDTLAPSFENPAICFVSRHVCSSSSQPYYRENPIHCPASRKAEPHPRRPSHRSLLAKRSGACKTFGSRCACASSARSSRCQHRGRSGSFLTPSRARWSKSGSVLGLRIGHSVTAPPVTPNVVPLIRPIRSSPSRCVPQPQLLCPPSRPDIIVAVPPPRELVVFHPQSP